MKKIAIALDYSDASKPVLDAGKKFAGVFGAELLLLHVVEPEPSYTAYGFTPDELPALLAYQDEASKRAQCKLDNLVAEVKSQCACDVVGKLLFGSPVHCLLDEVAESECDMVVVGSHGHGVLATLLIGSVADGLVRKAQVPTLVVPVKE